MPITNVVDAGNRTAAGIILASPERYAGGLTDWAVMFMERHPDSGKSADLPEPVNLQSVVKKPHSAQTELLPEAAA